MSIVIYTDQNGDLVIKVPPGHIKEFKQAMFRATNTWPDISEDMDQFSQMVQFGKVIYKRPTHVVYKEIENAPGKTVILVPTEPTKWPEN